MSYTMPTIRELQAKLDALSENFEPATNMCPDCEGAGGDCERCDGVGEIFESEDEDGVPSREEVIQSVIRHGPDSEYLYFIDFEVLEKLVNAGKVDDTIFAHWDNAQEEMDMMMQDAYAEFGEANQGGKTEHSGAKKGKGAYYGRKVAAKSDSNKARRDADKKSTVEESSDCDVCHGSGYEWVRDRADGTKYKDVCTFCDAWKKKKDAKEPVKEEYGCTSSTTGGYSDSDERVSFTQTKNQGEASVTVSANAKSMEELHTILKLAGIELPQTAHSEPTMAVIGQATQTEPEHGHSDLKTAILDKLQKSLSQKFNL